VYQLEGIRQLLSGRRALLGRRRGFVSRNVLLLGFTSLLTDLSAEMVAAILPLYLIYGLGLSPLQFGVVDGLYQGVTALVRVGGGIAGDRWRRHKEVAAIGYGISAVCKLGYAAVGNTLGALSGIVVADRLGKGIRTAPRDALISLSTSRVTLATAFGVHRALDTAGAMLGPLAAFAVLAAAPRAFDTVLLGRRRFQGLLMAGTALAVFTISDGFLYLAIQRHLDFDERFLPLLFVGSAFAYMLFAIPIGRVADRFGRGRVFVGGYILLLPLYTSLLLPAVGTAVLPLYLLLVGCYYAATDGVLMALASTILPEELRGSGLALLVTATSLGRLLASVLLGAIWTWVGLEAAVLSFGIGLVVAMSLAAILLRHIKEDVAYA
jgi:hypothetical protein